MIDVISFQKPIDRLGRIRLAIALLDSFVSYLKRKKLSMLSCYCHQFSGIGHEKLLLPIRVVQLSRVHTCAFFQLFICGIPGKHGSTATKLGFTVGCFVFSLPTPFLSPRPLETIDSSMFHEPSDVVRSR